MEAAIRAAIQEEHLDALAKLEEAKAGLQKETVLAEEAKLECQQLEKRLLAFEAKADKRYAAMQEMHLKLLAESDLIKSATATLEEQLKAAKDDFTREDLKREDTKKKLVLAKDNLDQQRSIIAVKRNNLAQSQDEGMRIRHLIDEKTNASPSTDQKRQLYDKRRTVKKLTVDKTDLEKEIIALKAEIESLELTLGSKETAINKLKAELNVNVGSKESSPRDQHDDVLVLKDKVLHLKKENEALRTHNLEGQAAGLRRELQQKQEDNARIRRRLNDSFARPSAPIEEKKCDCEVF